MTRYYWGCIFLFVLRFADGQDAAVMTATENLERRVACERALYAGTGDAHRWLLEKSRLYKLEGRFEEAYQTLQRATSIQQSDTITQISFLYESALTAYLNGKSDPSLSHLQELKYYFPDTLIYMADLVEILDLNEQERWGLAKEKTVAWSETFRIPIDSEMYAPMLHYKPLRPNKALLLSMLLPGSGQMYAGHWGKGFLSLLINAGLISFTVFNFSQGFYLSGAFTGVSLFYLFYNGGAQYAMELAEKYNKETTRNFKERVKEKLLSFQPTH